MVTTPFLNVISGTETGCPAFVIPLTERTKICSGDGSVSNHTIRHARPFNGTDPTPGLETPFAGFPIFVSAGDRSKREMDHPQLYFRGPHPIPAALTETHGAAGPMKVTGLRFVPLLVRRAMRPGSIANPSFLVSNPSQIPNGLGEAPPSGR